MAIEMTNDSAVCYRCGKKYGRKRGSFPASYAVLHKGVGFIPICKECVQKMYTTYLLQCNDPKDAARQICRKLDVYWNEGIYEQVAKKNANRALITSYLSKITAQNLAGKSYDDTLIEENSLWNFGKTPEPAESESQSKEDVKKVRTIDDFSGPVSDDVVMFWGPGYTDDMYQALEQRRRYWMSRFPDDTKLDIGTEAIIRQICSLELDINRDRAEGKSVDKSINALNTLLGSASLKPDQQKSTDSSLERTPFGVWIKRWETKRPIPETDPELKDVDGIIRYITIWFLGHLCKMLNIRNTYCRMYEEEMDKIRVERPEFEDDEDEDLFNHVFTDKVGDGDG